MEGKLSADLDTLDTQRLKSLIERSTTQEGPQQMDTDGDRLEVTVE
jgi:hypothetical protein